MSNLNCEQNPALNDLLPCTQNSTLLWEVLDGHVMDECLSLHHRIMREVGHLS